MTDNKEDTTKSALDLLNQWKAKQKEKKDGGKNEVQTSRKLPPMVKDWPWSAKGAYYDLLKQLNAWCKEFGYPFRFNHVYSERAVREVWK